MTEDDMNQIDESLRTIKSTCIIIRVFNPPHKQHWMWKSDYILKPTPYDGYLFPVCVNENIVSIHSTYLDNIIHIDPNSIVKYESYKEKDLDRYLRITKGLVGNGAMGRIYDGWNQISTDDFNAIDAPVIYGLDFGYSPDPTAIVGVKFVKNQLYVKQLLYATGLTDALLVQRMNDIGITSSDFIVADYGGGGGKSIAYLRTGVEVNGVLYKFNMFKAMKKDGIKGGIQIVKGYEINVTEHSKDVWNEYNLYRLRTDADGAFTPEPIDADNHAMDALRYVVAMKRLNLF
jgi:phage terminase large subunit